MDKQATNTILEILTTSGLLTDVQARDIVAKEDFYHSKLMKARSLDMRRSKSAVQDINIVDIIDSLKLRSADGDPINEQNIMKLVALRLGYSFETIDPIKLDSDVVTKVVSRPYAIKNHLVPLRVKDNTLTIATSNPFHKDVFEQLRLSTGKEIEVVVATRTDIYKVITEFYGFKSSVAAAEGDFTLGADLGNLEQYIKLKSITELDASDQHIVRAVEYLLHYAYGHRASDIHIEPKREHSLLRLRIDGILHVVHRMPKAIHAPFVTRIKAMARMDISEKRRPQDGRVKTSFENKEIELRVSTLPVSFGEKMVIRIFDPQVLMQDLQQLGFQRRDYELFRNYISSPHGLVIVTGPTGSGKTTTLYSALRTISSPEVSITTIEDPVEMVNEEFNQTAVHPQIGLTFGSVLRTILRQDPDIIMVGEIRDLETADNAIQAALTGHLVLSTLHTNDAPSSIARLLDLGVPAFLINSSLMGVIAQRLLRKVCTNCAEKYILSDDERNMLGLQASPKTDITVSIGRGCPACRGTGYLGRTGIFEVMDINDRLREATEAKATPSNIRKIARADGLMSLREAAVKKLMAGVTTVDEIIRVLGVTAASHM